MTPLADHDVNQIAKDPTLGEMDAVLFGLAVLGVGHMSGVRIGTDL